VHIWQHRNLNAGFASYVYDRVYQVENRGGVWRCGCVRDR
jgi:hypothetical protein